MSVLGALLEGFDEARHPRDFHGRWRKGDKVHVVTPQGHVERGVVEKPAETHDTITSKGSERSTTVQVRWEDGDVTHERPSDIRAGHKYGSIGQAARAGALPSQREKTGRPTGRKYDSIGAAARAGALPSQQPGSDPPPLPANAPERRFDPVTMLGREGTAARERGAANINVQHADLRDKLTNLPQGQRYGLHGPEGSVGHVERTAAGWEVHGPKGAETHKTPSSASGHAMRIERQADANYRARQQTRARNLDRMGVPLGKIGEPVSRKERGSRKAFVRESAPGVLGALLGAG